MSFHWQKASWPTGRGVEISHLHAEDLRRWLFLILNSAATADKAADYIGDGNWTDVMHAEDTEDPRDPDEPGVPYWWPGNSGGVYLHGEPVVWYEESYTSSIIEVNPDENYVIVSGDKVSAAEGGHFRIGDPLLISGNPDNNGFYRVSSADLDGSNTKVYLTTSPAKLATTAKGGTLSCDFGGDWFCSYGFWSWTDTCHDSTKTKNRPPAGGIYSADSAGSTSLSDKGYGTCWVRTVNPYLYHHYDKNSHRRIVRTHYDSDTDDHYIYDNLACDWLPVQVDPKEQTEPVLYRDTNRKRWIYGSKVGLQKHQLTDTASMGPIRALIDEESPNTNQYRCDTSDQEYPESDEAFEPRVNSKLTSSALQSMVEYYVSSYNWYAPVDDAYKANWIAKNAAAGDPLSGGSSPCYNETYGQSGTYNPAKNPAQPSYAPLCHEYFGCNGSAFEKLLKDYGEFDWWFDKATPFTPGWVLSARWSMINEGSPPPGEAAADKAYPKPTGTWRRTWKYSLGKIHPVRMQAKEAGDPTGDTWPAQKICSSCNTSTSYDNTFFSPWIGVHDGYWTAAWDGDDWVQTWHDDTDIDYTPEDSDFSNFDYEITVEDNGCIFTVAGDRVSKFSPGSTIWFEGASTGMGVVYSKYAGGVTTVQVDTELTTADDGKTVYGDTRLAARHDPVQIADGVSHIEAYHNILQDCYEILSQLTLKHSSVQLEVKNKSFVGTAEGSYSSEQDCAIQSINNMEDETDPDDPVDPWTNGSSGVGIGKKLIVKKVVTGYTAGSQTKWLGAYKLTREDEDIFARLNLKLKCRNYVGSPPWNPRYTVTFNSPGGGSITVPADGIDYYYWFALNSSALNADWYIIRSTTPYRTNIPCGAEPGYYSAANLTGVWLYLDSEAIYEFDWNNFDDEIWERDITRATRIEQDPTADDDPPEPDPPDFHIGPILYDANYDDAIRDGWIDPYDEDECIVEIEENYLEVNGSNQISLGDVPYESYGDIGTITSDTPSYPTTLTEVESGPPASDEFVVDYDTGVITFHSDQSGAFVNVTYNTQVRSYTAEWHILMTAELCEDLEGNTPVKYRFTGSGGAAGYTSAWQESRTYDFKLGDGTMAALQTAIDAGLKTSWQFTCRAKDNASAAGAGQTDNIGSQSAESTIDTSSSPL